MYIVENLVFYSCAKLNLVNLKSKKDLEFLKNDYISNISFESYWFSRFDIEKYGYLKLEIRNFKDIFDKNLKIDKFLDSFYLKIHSDGVSSVELYFNFEDKIDSFDRILDEFTAKYSDKIFDLVFKINLELNQKSLLELSSNYAFATLLETDKNKKSKLNLENLDKNSFGFRVHSFSNNKKEYEEIQKFYKNEGVKSKSTIVAINKDCYEATIFNTSVLWSIEKLTKDSISLLLDIDTHTLKESVIYEKSSFLYTNQMFYIDFEESHTIDSNKLFEMHKINRYFLQKNRLDELGYSENIDSYVTIQREIEEFEIQEEIFDKSEKNFLDIQSIIDGNQKSKANKVIQYILLFLTLFTILSMGMDIIEFIEVEFGTSKKVSFDLVSKVEIIAILIAVIFALFYKASDYIKKS